MLNTLCRKMFAPLKLDSVCMLDNVECALQNILFKLRPKQRQQRYGSGGLRSLGIMV